ncbi:MAG: hypothetical protein WD851_19205 [Pirellulales bacterium]
MDDNPRKPIGSRTLLCDGAVLFRNAETAGGLVDRLQDAADLRANGFSIRLGKLGERVVALGIAAKSTSLVEMTDAIAHAHKPQLVVVGTLAVGLADGLAANTVLLASGLTGKPNEQLELPTWANSACPRGPLWATNRLRSPPGIDALAAIPHDIYAAAKWCREHDIAIEIAAVITRHAAEPPPADVRQVLNQRSIAGRVGAFLGAAWRRPGSVPDLWREKETVWIARERLADAIEKIISPAN